MSSNKDIKIVMQKPNSTVVSEYKRGVSKSTTYQSEAELEKEFIRNLETQAYEYLSFSSEEQLIINLRNQLEKLNDYKFSNQEWEHLFNNVIAKGTNGIPDKTRLIQEDYIQSITRDDGTTKNIYLIDKNNIHKNSLQVINQYENTGNYENRYDVTILVNGLPLVHVELKRRGIALKEAFNQINRYQRDSFWSNSGLYEYVQIFVISNGTHTKYYSNTTRDTRIRETEQGTKSKTKKTSNSFEFTSWWADSKNNRIPDLVDFTKTFFAKHTILNILTKYCVFTSEQLLLAMRPYQIVATEKIISKIERSTNYRKQGTVEAGGYVWHTTGSGKTLTSFKTAQLVSRMEFIYKTVFIVDRKDLDYQTMKEYEKFQKDCVNGSKDTKELKKGLEDPHKKILVTTIQKMNQFIKQHSSHTVFNQNVVLIFDECHRSQFGEFHKNITKTFKHFYIFGFTGTPIFAINSSNANSIDLKTTEQAFGEKLHSYTIIDAIQDGNVLPFRIDYINSVKPKEDITGKAIKIDTESALLSKGRISAICKYIIEHFDQKTFRNKNYYRIKDKKMNGFNSILAVQSIEAAKKYYLELHHQQKDTPVNAKLKIATIFSYAPNEDDPSDGLLADEDFELNHLESSSRDFLDFSMDNYNKMFKTSFSTTGSGDDSFQNYYKDVSKRVKEKEIDLLIVVNMFLTGFDATTLNTLWIDRNLRLHGLLQAFSRTNRILNSIKVFGNIICFRDIEKETDEAVSLFGDKEAKGIVILKTFDEYYLGYEHNGKHIFGYEELIKQLQEKYASLEIVGEDNEKEFIKLYGAILKIKNILSAFDEFSGREILTELDFQDYQSIYLDLYHKLRGQSNFEKENIVDDLIFEIELIKQTEVNIDYILHLVEKYHKSHCADKEILAQINKAITSSPSLRLKKELIDRFVESINVDKASEWSKFVDKCRKDELNKIIAEDNLKKKETYEYINDCFRDGIIKENGTSIGTVLPPISMFDQNNKRSTIKQRIIQKLKTFFEKFFDISSTRITD